MNTHAEKVNENKSHQMASISHAKSGVEPTLKFSDNRPEAQIQRKIKQLAINGQRKEWVTQRRLKEHVLNNQTAPIQCVIGPKPEDPFRPNLAWAQWFAAMNDEELVSELGKLGLDKESGVVALMNQVLKRQGLNPITDAVPDQQQEQGIVFREPKAKVEEDDDDGVDQAKQKGAAMAKAAEEEEDDPDTKLEKRLTPTTLRINKGDKRKLILELLNVFGEVVATVVQNEGTTKTITGKLLGQKVTAKGTYAIPKGNSHPEFAKTLHEFAQKAQAEAHLEKLQQQGALKGKGKNPTQAELYGHLRGAMEAATGKGHEAVQMAKVPLIKAVPYDAYGKRHEVTHLYVQSGNQTEIRCYLGTNVGPFQRIHTSLTVIRDETPTSHTMVQTGAHLGIPPFKGPKGERVGFDSVETAAGMGFGKRLLAERSKAQCTVKDYIDGKTLAEIGVDNEKVAREMAASFNHTLDLVAKDISQGDLGKRGITWLSEFNPIDEAK